MYQKNGGLRTWQDVGVSVLDAILRQLGRGGRTARTQHLEKLRRQEEQHHHGIMI